MQGALLNYSSHRLSAFDSSLGGSRVSWANQYMVAAYMTASLLQAKTADAFLPRLHIRHMKDHCGAWAFSLTEFQTGRSQGGGKKKFQLCELILLCQNSN